MIELYIPGVQIVVGPLLQGRRQIIIETFQCGQFVLLHEGHFLHRIEALRGQQLRHHFIYYQRFHEQLAALAQLFLAAVRFFLFGQNINFPAGQLRGQPHVLTTPADSQTQHVIRHHDFEFPGLLVHHHLNHISRRQAFDQESRRIGQPLDNIDFLALQFVNHRLDPTAPHADTSADRIDTGIIGHHCDLGPAAGIPCNRLDLDNAVIDFRHFLGKQFRHELGMGAGEKNLRATQFVAHVINIGSDPVTLTQAFPRQCLVPTYDSLGPSQINQNVAIFDPFNDTIDHFANAVLIFLVLPFPLRLAHLLHNNLLGGLGCDAAEVDRRQGFRD